MRTNLFERLATIWQDHSVNEYIDAFVSLTSQVDESAHQSLDYFLSGLLDDIRIRIRSRCHEFAPDNGHCLRN